LVKNVTVVYSRGLFLFIFRSIVNSSVSVCVCVFVSIFLYLLGTCAHNVSDTFISRTYVCIREREREREIGR
jgi:hypothetical protein